MRGRRGAAIAPGPEAKRGAGETTEVDNAIFIQDLWKRFAVSQHRSRSLKDAMLRGWRRGRWAEQFWALREVTLEVAQGETVAIIGPNGSGKSTLLSIIGNILLPTRGRVEVNGRTATLLDIGAGFHEDLTGVENVYLYGSLLGIKRRDLSRRLDDIIELAGLRDSIDAPIRTYSSGMQMRLGFSVAINVDPAILLIDEVLAVGDAAFQEKCRQKVRALQEAGKTILFVSHDMEEVMEVASRAVWLLDGRVAADGDVAEVVSKHLQHGANAGSLAAAST